MEYLQYYLLILAIRRGDFLVCFKPYYKWNTFNTIDGQGDHGILHEVLNLIINGIPSILNEDVIKAELDRLSFKPYYKWNTFNT